MNVVASESVKKVASVWEHKTDAIELVPVTKALVVYENDLMYAAFEDISDSVNTRFFDIGYMVSECTLSSSDANNVMISVDGISMANQSNSLGGLEWKFNGSTHVIAGANA